MWIQHRAIFIWGGFFPYDTAIIIKILSKIDTNILLWEIINKQKEQHPLCHDTMIHQPIHSLCSLSKLKARCSNYFDTEESSIRGGSPYVATDRESTDSGILSHISSFGDSLGQDQEFRCSTPYGSHPDVRWTVLCGKRDNYLSSPPEGDVWWYTQTLSQQLPIK